MADTSSLASRKKNLWDFFFSPRSSQFNFLNQNDRLRYDVTEHRVTYTMKIGDRMQPADAPDNIGIGKISNQTSKYVFSALPGAHILRIKFPKTILYCTLSHQLDALALVKWLTPNITELEILPEATDSTNSDFLSRNANEYANILKETGLFLEKITIRVNNRAARDFIALAEHLSKKGCLKHFDMTPIGTWKAETQALYDKFQDDNPTLCDTAAARKLKELSS